MVSTRLMGFFFRAICLTAIESRLSEKSYPKDISAICPKISCYALPCLLGFLLSAGIITWFFFHAPEESPKNILLLFFLMSAVLSLTAMRLYSIAMRKVVHELAQGRNRLEVAIESSNAGVYEYLASSLECTFINERWPEIFGYSLDELPEMKELLPWWHKQIHPDDYESVALAHEQFLLGKRNDLSIEFRQKHCSGDDRYVEIHAKAAERDKDGAIIKVTGILRDISDRKISEIRLGQLNRILHAIRDINKLIVRENNPETFLQKACDIIYEAKGFYSVWATSLDKARHAKFSACAGFGDEFHEMAAALKNGKLYGHCSTALLQNEPLISINPGKNCPGCPIATYYQRGMGIICRIESKGAVLGLLVISVERGFASNPEELALIKEIADDIGFALHTIALTKEQERTLTELRVNENKYRTLIENIPQKIFIKDKDSKYVSCNENYADSLGIRPDGIVGKSDVEFFPEELAEKYCTADTRIMADGMTVDMEEEYREEGKTYWNHVIKTPVLDETGTVTGILGVLWDITERKEAEKERKLLEEEFRQAQKMEALGTLTGGIAHDFNNILSSVLGFAEILEQDLGNDTLHQSHARQIIVGANRAKELIRQLLMFSRKSGSGKSPLPFSSLVKEVMKLLRATLPSSITINTRIAPDTGCVVANPTQLHQVIMDLCMNAYQAMGEKGTLEVSLESFTVEDKSAHLFIEKEAKKYVKLTVQDSGSGMSQEVQERMFEPFFTTKGVGKGSGLGLSVVHGIVEELNGVIRCQSVLKQGTCFEIYLPEVEAVPMVIETKSIVPIEKKRTGVILMVDDESSVVMIWGMVAKRLGYTVVTATCSKNALELFKKEPDRFDLLVTDMTMPEMTGDVLIMEIRKIRQNIPIILCTGLTARIPDDFIRENDILLMMKPVSKIKLEEAIVNSLHKDG